ncbi:MAG: hypothetical protein WC696_01455 [Candidatus Methylopumilus sp.]
MCNPLAITAGLSVLQYVGGKATAENQYEATAKQTELGYEQNAVKQEQVNDKYALEESERVKQGMLERAKIATIAGESGALGLSADRLLGDSLFQEGTDRASLEKNRSNEILQTSWDGRLIQARGESSNAQTASREPTLIGTGLQIGAGVWSASNKAKDKAKATVE